MSCQNIQKRNFRKHKRCHTPVFTDEELQELYLKALNQLLENKDKVLEKDRKLEDSGEETRWMIAKLEKEEGPVNKFTVSLWSDYVDHLTVYSRDDVKVTFRDGTVIKSGVEEKKRVRRRYRHRSREEKK